MKTCVTLFLAALLAEGGAQSILKDANNCYACVRCSGIWIVNNAPAMMVAACVKPSSLTQAWDPRGSALTTSLLIPSDCSGGSGTTNFTCMQVCGSQGPCAPSSLCGADCPYQKPPQTQCPIPYPYNELVVDVCDRLKKRGFAISNNNAVLTGHSMPRCDCPAQASDRESAACSEGGDLAAGSALGAASLQNILTRS
jgi:hypothetical protein